MSIFIGKNLLHLTDINSTNEYAKEVIQSGECPEGTIVLADYQSGGKGYGNNYWESERNKNLTFSVVLFPKVVPPDEMFAISKAVSLALVDYLSTIFWNVSVKWPNDIYIQHDKIAGILIENAFSGNEIQYSIIGIGLNVNQTLFTRNPPNPTSMKLRAARNFNVMEILPVIATYIENRYLQLFTDFVYQLDEQYLSRLYQYDTYNSYRSRDGVFIAKIIDVTNLGNIVLQTQEGEEKSFGFKEIEFI